MLPCRLKTSEFGVAGKLRNVPTVFAGAVMGTVVLMQPSVVPHAVLLTYTVPAVDVPGTAIVTAVCG